jgi:hypothetical protein
MIIIIHSIREQFFLYMFRNKTIINSGYTASKAISVVQLFVLYFDRFDLIRQKADKIESDMKQTSQEHFSFVV